MATRQAAYVRLHRPATEKQFRQPVVEVDSIEWRNVEYRFHPPLRLKRSKLHGHVVFENHDLSLYAFGKSDKDALNALARDFAAVWGGIAQEEDAKLESMARSLKKRLRKAVASIWQKKSARS